VGSLKAVAAMNGPNEGRVVKVIDYDAFGNILADSNPGLFMPLAFAGGLRDRFTGLVRFRRRDYDPTVGRFTAPDPLGDTGGDHDLYDYCVDEPVGRIDPEGLFIVDLYKGIKALFGFKEALDKQTEQAKKTDKNWEEGIDACMKGEGTECLEKIEDAHPKNNTNSTVGAGGRVGSAGVEVLKQANPFKLPRQ
jgi:RHS repeat-associated protein